MVQLAHRAREVPSNFLILPGRFPANSVYYNVPTGALSCLVVAKQFLTSPTFPSPAGSKVGGGGGGGGG